MPRGVKVKNPGKIDNFSPDLHLRFISLISGTVSAVLYPGWNFRKSCGENSIKEGGLK
jgi:hypothetical protein